MAKHSQQSGKTASNMVPAIDNCVRAEDVQEAGPRKLPASTAIEPTGRLPHANLLREACLTP